MTWRQQAGNFDSPINPEYEQEARLVDQARAGSERAFSALLARYQQPVFRLIFYLVGDADEARELSRIALKHALTRMPRVPAGYSVRPWLLRVATLVALDSVRERSESPQALIASLQLPPAPQPTARIIDSDPTLSETMELSITKLEENPELEVADAWDRLPIDVERELVRRLLASLPENDAELLALGVVGQVPTRDLAAISGTSQRSIRRRIARALILFQSHYQMIRQEALPPPPPTRELEPGNISAVMAIHVARRGLNEATERMRRSWHNVRASLGSVEAQESLQTLRDEDVPTATPSRPLTAPTTPPSTSRVRPSPVTRTIPPSPTVADKPPRLAVTDEQTVILPPPTASAPARPPAPALPVADASTTSGEKPTTIEDLAIAMQGKSDTISPTHDAENPVDLAVGAAAAATVVATSDRHESAEEPTHLVTQHDDAATIATQSVTHDEHADVAPEQRPTAIRQLPRFGPPAEVAAEAVLAEDVLVTEEARPLDEEFMAVAPENESRDEHAILMPPAHNDAEEDEDEVAPPFNDSDDVVTFADDIAVPSPSDVDDATNDTADESTADVVIAGADQGLADAGDIAAMPAPITDIAELMPADEAAVDAEPFFVAPLDAAPDEAFATQDAPMLAETTQVGDDEAVADAPVISNITVTDVSEIPNDASVTDLAGTAEDLTAAPQEATIPTTTEPDEAIIPLVALADEEAPSADLSAIVDEDVVSDAAVLADTTSVAPSAADITTTADPANATSVDDAVHVAEIEASSTEGAIPVSATDETFTETEPAATEAAIEDEALTAAKTMPKTAAANAPTSVEAEADDASVGVSDDAQMRPETVSATEEPETHAADVPPYIARQEERTLPVSRHFGDTVVMRDDARLDYVARHQGKPIDLSDLSGIIGAAFSEQAEEPEEMPSPAQPPSAGVLHIMPESTTSDDGLFASLAQSDPDATIVAKPIAQPAREEVTTLTQPADLADLAGILAQMTQIRHQPTDAMPVSPETRPRRVTRPMPRLERDAPEPPNEES